MTEITVSAAQLLVMKQIPVGVHCPQGNGFIRIEITEVDTYISNGHKVLCMLTSGRVYEITQRQPGRGARYFALDKG